MPRTQVENARHRRAGVPDALQAVAAGAHDDRRLLPAGGAPVQRRQVVGHDLQGVEQVIEVLDLGDRAQAAQGQADRLPEDGRFADAGIGDAQRAVFLLQAAEALVDVAQLADILAKGDQARLAGEGGIESRR